jgi:hypothetical protein
VSTHDNQIGSEIVRRLQDFWGDHPFTNHHLGERGAHIVMNERPQLCLFDLRVHRTERRCNRVLRPERRGEEKRTYGEDRELRLERLLQRDRVLQRPF